MTVIAEAGRLWPSAFEAWWPAVAFVAGPYTVAGGTAIAANCGPMDVTEMEGWLREHWAGIPIRGERRPVKSPAKMAASIVSTRAWAYDLFEGNPDWNPDVPLDTPYEELWAGVQKHCRYMGRYGAMKLLETWKRGDLIGEGQPDIRPDGAKYPRRMLAALFNEPALRVAPKEGGSGNRTEALMNVQSYALTAKGRVGYDLTWCSFETLLCNYRQFLTAPEKKYPGGSHDRELAHWIMMTSHFGRDADQWFDFYGARKRLFPHEYLAELR